MALAAKWEHRCHPWRLACPVYLRRTRARPGAAVKPTAENSWGKGQADWPAAGSVVVTAETLHRLSWGLPGAKTVSPDEYEVPLWWPCASTQVWGTWSWRRTDGGQTTKASAPAPHSPAWALPEPGCGVGNSREGRGVSWEHWSGAESCRAPSPHSHSPHASWSPALCVGGLPWPGAGTLALEGPCGHFGDRPAWSGNVAGKQWELQSVREGRSSSPALSSGPGRPRWGQAVPG